MIGEGTFRASVNEVAGLLKALELYGRMGRYQPRDEVIRRARNTPGFREEWQLFLSEQLFSFVLRDFSILQFQIQPNNARELVSYVFFECPLEAMSEDDFRLEFADVSAELDYEEYLFSCDERPHPMYFRYDFSPALYREFVHPCGHLHVGHRTEVRLAVKRCWSPMAFACFVARQVYPSAWEQHLKTSDEATRARLVRAVRDGLEETPGEFWRHGDATQHCLV